MATDDSITFRNVTNPARPWITRYEVLKSGTPVGTIHGAIPSADELWHLVGMNGDERINLLARSLRECKHAARVSFDNA